MQLVHRTTQLDSPSKPLRNLDRCAELVEWLDFEDLEIVELADPVLRVLLEQFLQDDSRVGNETFEERGGIASQSIRPIAPADDRSVPRDEDKKI